MILPYKSGTVTFTSRFGLRTLNGKLDNHKGIDLAGTDKTLVAPCDGVVAVSTMLDRATDATRTWEWGNYIRIDTPDGLNVYMCHMSERKVKAGQTVKAGDVVGIEGSTGYSTGCHLHFEIRRNGVSVNPCTYLGIPNEWAEHKIEEQKEKTMDDEKKTADSVPSEWAEDAVEWAVENEIIFGTGDGDLRLRDACTREQMLVFLHRFAQMIGKA